MGDAWRFNWVDVDVPPCHHLPRALWAPSVVPDIKLSALYCVNEWLSEKPDVDNPAECPCPPIAKSNVYVYGHRSTSPDAVYEPENERGPTYMVGSNYLSVKQPVAT